MLMKEISDIKKVVLKLKTENIELKEKNFDLYHTVEKNEQMAHVYSSLTQKLNKKIEILRTQQQNAH